MRSIRYALCLSAAAMLIGLQLFSVMLDTQSGIRQRKADGQMKFTAGEILDGALQSKAWIFSSP